jgi:F0F1-type ATP synthase membrane subunit b/b'
MSFKRGQWGAPKSTQSKSIQVPGEMNMKHTTLTVMIAALALITATAFAAEPVHNVGAKRHPNLAAAQRLTDQAFQKITAAQQANEFDMDGHAAKAKDLLDQANRELKQAAEAANHN